MGYYIEGPTKGKAKYIVDNFNGEIVMYSHAHAVIRKPNVAVIIVLDNGPFEAAGYAYDEDEFHAFTLAMDNRPKTFILMNRSKANELTGRVE